MVHSVLLCWSVERGWTSDLKVSELLLLHKRMWEHDTKQPYLSHVIYIMRCIHMQVRGRDRPWHKHYRCDEFRKLSTSTEMIQVAKTNSQRPMPLAMVTHKISTSRSQQQCNSQTYAPPEATHFTRPGKYTFFQHLWHLAYAFSDMRCPTWSDDRRSYIMVMYNIRTLQTLQRT